MSSVELILFFMSGTLLVSLVVTLLTKGLAKASRWILDKTASDNRTELERLMENQFGNEDLSKMKIGADRDLNSSEEEQIDSSNVRMVPERNAKDSLHEYMFEGCVEFSPDHKKKLCETCGEKFEGNSNECGTCQDAVREKKYITPYGQRYSKKRQAENHIEGFINHKV